MVKYGMLVDLKSCLGCRTCMTACKNVNQIPLGNYSGRQYYRLWPADIELGKYPYVTRNTTALRCMQCQNAPCMDACPIPGALTQRPDGIIVVDATKCTGCLYCVAACPYGAMYFRPDLKAVDKCDLCAAQLDAGVKAPTCVTTCMGDALTFGDISDPKSTISVAIAALGAAPLSPEYSTSPSIYYTTHSGILHAQVVDDLGNVVTTATPTLTDLSNKTSTSTSLDSNGEFAFRSLKIGKTYSLTIAGTGYRSYVISTLTVTSEYQDLGTVRIYP